MTHATRVDCSQLTGNATTGSAPVRKSRRAATTTGEGPSEAAPIGLEHEGIGTDDVEGVAGHRGSGLGAVNEPMGRLRKPGSKIGV
jgi:hypothetical protein